MSGDAVSKYETRMMHFGVGLRSGSLLPNDEVHLPAQCVFDQVSLVEER